MSGLRLYRIYLGIITVQDMSGSLHYSTEYVRVFTLQYRICPVFTLQYRICPGLESTEFIRVLKVQDSSGF